MNNHPFFFGIFSLFLASVGIVTFLGVQLNHDLQVQSQQGANSDANNLRQPTQPPAVISQPTSHPTTFKQLSIQPTISSSSNTERTTVDNPTPSIVPTIVSSEAASSKPSFRVSPSPLPPLGQIISTAVPTILLSTISPTSLSPTKPPPTFASIKPTLLPSITAPTLSSSTHPSATTTSFTPNFHVTSSQPTLKPDYLTSTANWTDYNIYPKCCPGEPNYDPTYPTTECVEDNGCAYPGQLAALGYRSLNFVETNNLVAFYDNSDPKGTNFYTKYAGKNITITGSCNGTSKTFVAIIADTCGNSDCSNCCQKNADSQTGYLIDMDYYTVINNFGSTSCVGGTLQFSINLNQPAPVLSCGAEFGGCSSQYCCGANGICGTGSSYCGTGCQLQYGNCSSTS